MAIMKNHHHPHFHTPKLEASVGLAIVAALHLKPSNTGGEILINHIVLSSPRSDPIPVITNNNNNNNMMVDDEDEDENYTYVTSRGAANPVTRVYHHRPTGDGGCVVTTLKPLMYSKVEDQTSNKNIDHNNDNSNELSNFLSSCDMCRKNLAGKDIYMYRGEKAFCSEECRHRQIASDEREEKLCRRRPSKTTSSVSRSPCYYETGHIFSTGIISTY